MNVTDYTYLMNKPDAITEKQAEALGNVLNEFPYFQSARALRLKGLYNQNSFKYNYALKVTAAHTTDRSVLFDFITSEAFTSIQSEYYDKKLKDLLNITVFDSEIVLAEEKKKLAEVRIDPIEQSILNSIKEATGVTFEEPAKTEEKPVDTVIEQPTVDSFTEPTTVTFEERVVEENSIDFVIEQPALDSFTETTTVTFEEPVVAEEKLIETFMPTLDSFQEVIIATFKEPIVVEEKTIEPVTEQIILDSFKEVTTVTFEEPAKVEEKIIDAIIEQPTLDSFEEVPTTTFEEPLNSEEKTIDLVFEPTLDSFTEVTPTIEETPIAESTPIIKGPTPTFFDEVVEEEIPDVRVEPIEETVYNSLQEVSTVVFEEVPVIEESKEIEEPKEIAVSETVKTAEENLEIGKPLDFSVNEKHSFQEWLQLAKTEPIDRSKDALEESETIQKTENTVEKAIEPETIKDEKKKKAEIIDKFIEANPKISPIKQTAIVPAVQLDSNNEENSYLMTETLARVYLEQKKYTKAIQAYEILILKYPEKISFFADRISDIKILQQNNNNN
jgi:hypothetical protein